MKVTCGSAGVQPRGKPTRRGRAAHVRSTLARIGMEPFRRERGTARRRGSTTLERDAPHRPGSWTSRRSRRLREGCCTCERRPWASGGVPPRRAGGAGDPRRRAARGAPHDRLGTAGVRGRQPEHGAAGGVAGTAAAHDRRAPDHARARRGRPAVGTGPGERRVGIGVGPGGTGGEHVAERASARGRQQRDPLRGAEDPRLRPTGGRLPGPAWSTRRRR
jgi:hypothetical protein